MLADFTRELLLCAVALDKQAEWCEKYLTAAPLRTVIRACSCGVRDRGRSMVDLLSQYETVGLQAQLPRTASWIICPLYHGYLACCRKRKRARDYRILLFWRYWAVV